MEQPLALGLTEGDVGDGGKVDLAVEELGPRVVRTQLQV